MTLYDKVDWYLDAAISAGQPAERAFTHIAFYLAWLIRRDLHDPTFFPDNHLQAVKDGDMTGSDLADDIDGKLVSHVMRAEGAAFSDARYPAYLSQYEALFDDLPDFSVVDEPAHYARAERLLDRLYDEWVAEGRPTPAPEPPETPTEEDSAPTRSVVMFPPDFSTAEIDSFLAEYPGGELEVASLVPDATDMPHASPELEALLPRDLTDPPLDVSSARASDWRSSLLDRALKRLEVRREEAIVVSGIGGLGEATLTVTVYQVPGVAAERLESELKSVVFVLPGSRWERRTVAGREVEWASGREFTVALWARDGMAVHLAGQPGFVEGAIPRLS